MSSSVPANPLFRAYTPVAYGLWGLSLVSLLLVIFSAAHAWQRPVTVLSRIPFRSEIYGMMSGVVHENPSGRYAQVDLQKGDVILQYDGLSWENTHRLNYHELPLQRPGETIPLLVQRQDQQITVLIPVVLPDAWEQFILLRFSLSAFLCWLPVLVLLNLLHKTLLQNQSTEHHPLANSSMTLWIMTWNILVIFFATAAFKYPIFVLWTDISGRVLPLLVALCYLPYPFAPADKRSPKLTAFLTLLGVVTALAIIWSNWQSPYPDPDWRRSIQLLRPEDAAHFWTHIPMLLGFLLASGGLLVTALSTSIRQVFNYLAHHGPLYLQPQMQKLAHTMQEAYGDCHPGIIIVFQYQFLIVVLVIFLDTIPIALGVSGHGYNLLWFCMPISYLLLHANFQALKRIYYWLRIVLASVLILQIFTQFTHWYNQTFSLGSNLGDWIILFVMLGGIVVAALLAIYTPATRPYDDIQTAMDGLFLQPSASDFWTYLTQTIGHYVKVSTWVWLGQNEAGEWEVLATTPPSPPRWLNDPTLQQILASKVYHQQPLNAVVDTITLPTTLILLPIVRHQKMSEMIIAANPAQVQEGSYLLDSPVFHNRLMSAVHALRSNEHQQQMVIQQQQLAHYQQHLAKAYQELHRQQRNSARSSNLLISATLHDKALQRLAGVVQELRHHPQNDGVVLEPIVQECLAIDHEIRRVLRDLRPKGSEQQLGAVLEDAVSQWEFQYRSIRFVYTPPSSLPWLSELHRVSLFLIINQAVENALEHAHPRTIYLSIAKEEAGLRLMIKDDGVGFVYHADYTTTHSLGLLLMHDIAEEIGAELTINTRPGAGCSVAIFLPWPDSPMP